MYLLPFSSLLFLSLSLLDLYLSLYFFSKMNHSDGDNILPTHTTTTHSTTSPTHTTTYTTTTTTEERPYDVKQMETSEVYMFDKMATKSEGSDYEHNTEKHDIVDDESAKPVQKRSLAQRYRKILQ